MPPLLPNERRSILQVESRLLVSVLGGAGVGKTSIINKFLHNRFTEVESNTIEDLHKKHFLLDHKEYVLEILDTCGKGEFPELRKEAITKADAFILVYSVLDENSFNEISSIRQLILATKKFENCPILVVGNKCDVSDKERKRERFLRELFVSQNWRSGYIECSAKTGKNIVQVFRETIRQNGLFSPLSPTDRSPEKHNRKKFKSCCVM